MTMFDEQVRILCVDDETNVLKSLRRLFLDENYEVLTAETGPEGIEILKNTATVQLVISDYRMPGMNGVDFLRQVYEQWPDTIRIVLSGYADTAVVVEAVNDGHIYKFIPKPWNDNDLKATISNALERYFLYKRNRELAEKLKKANDQLLVVNQNLETLVEQRTEEIRFHNRALIVAQNILDALPVAVLGMDPAGLIVHCNQKASSILSEVNGSLLGNKRESALPQEINCIIDKIMVKGDGIGRVETDGKRITIKGEMKKFEGVQEVVILVLYEEGENGCE
mgnify:CR=1 FL=1